MSRNNSMIKNLECSRKSIPTDTFEDVGCILQAEKEKEDTEHFIQPAIPMSISSQAISSHSMQHFAW